MLRRVHFPKAISAGLLASLGWEAAARTVDILAIPAFDITHTLGSMFTESSLWWPIGFSLHAGIGVIWALFYSYFFFSATARSKPFNGMLFSLLPMLLALFIMTPNLLQMHEYVVAHQTVEPGLAGYKQGLQIPISIAVGHLLYGAILGYLYRRPIGYAVSREQNILRTVKP